MLNVKGFRTVSIAGFLSSAAYSLFGIPYAIKNALFLSSSTIPYLSNKWANGMRFIFYDVLFSCSICHYGASVHWLRNLFSLPLR